MTREEGNMTREEAIKILRSEICEPYTGDYSDEQISIATKKGIEALEQESVLHKIRALIEQHRRKTQSIDPYDLVGDCLEIIDECMKEPE